MLTLLLWRKVSNSVILLLNPFALHCISRRQLVGAGVESRVHLYIAGTLKQKSEQQSRYRPLRHQKGDLTSRESLEVLGVDGRRSGREEATSIQTSLLPIFSLAVVVALTSVQQLYPSL